MPTKYNSVSSQKFQQLRPKQATDSHYPDQRHTDSYRGYYCWANKERGVLLANTNFGVPTYRWHVTISDKKSKTVDQIKTKWAKTTRKLRAKGLVAAWYRELYREGGLHYHLIIKPDWIKKHKGKTITGEWTQKSLHKAIKDSIPGHRVSVTEHQNDFVLATYVLKLDPKHKSKLLLFQPNLGLEKCGTIGDFYPAGKSNLRKPLQKKAKTIRENQHKVWDLGKTLYEWFGQSIKLQKIIRPLALHAESDAVRRMISANDAGELGWELNFL